MKYILFLVFLISGFLSYGQAAPKDHYVILPFDKSVYTSLSEDCTQATLNNDDIANIERVLSFCVNKYNHSQNNVYKEIVKKLPDQDLRIDDYVIDLKRYYRQYVVVYNKRGEKEVWVNCFCNIQSPGNWREKPVIVMGGGNCFFNVRINLTRKSYSDFMVNGLA
ncbi:MAG TPA: hypothetical protein VFE04_06795 [Puia sp.]|nr:hypothetical protein [Puia sp.]